MADKNSSDSNQEIVFETEKSKKIIGEVTKQFTTILSAKLKQHEDSNEIIFMVRDLLQSWNDTIKKRTKKTLLIFFITSILSIFISVGVVGTFFYKALQKREALTVETAHQIQTIINMADEQILLAKIEKDIRSIIRAQKAHCRKNGDPWKPYEAKVIKGMAYEILFGYRLRGVRPEEVYTIISSETMWRTSSKWIESPKGALGLMQIMPSTWNEICRAWGFHKLNPRNPVHSLRVGIIHLSNLKQHTKNPSFAKIYQDWTFIDIAAAYNSGLNYYSQYYNARKKGKEKILYPETSEYMKKASFYLKNYTTTPPNFSVVYNKK